MVGALYLAADALLALSSVALAHWFRTDLLTPRPLFPLEHYAWLVPLLVGLWVLTGLFLGIYREIREEELRRALSDPLSVTLVATTLLFALTFALKLDYISRLLLGLFSAIQFAAMLAFRLLARRFGEPLRGAFGAYRHFLIVGLTGEALEIARHLEAHARRGLRLLGFASIKPREEKVIGGRGLMATYPIHGLERVPELLRQHVIDEVIFAVAKDDLEKLESTFLACEEEGVKTRVLLSFFPHVTSKVYLERLREIPLLTFTTTPANEYLLLVKRLADFLMALMLASLLAPVMLAIAALIKLTSKGPVLYRQTRCGLGGRRFTVYKFRSMRADADLRREELAALNEMDGPVFKVRNDPRATRLGRFLRRYSLDELPQLFNILKGEMSFVGPRPPLPEEVQRYEPWQRRRLRMLPGLTCLWALEGRNELSFRRWMELDLEYIDNWSPSLDWKILLRTIPVVLSGRGAS